MFLGVVVAVELKVFCVFLNADVAWAEEPPFQSFVGAVIIANSLIMGGETDVFWSGWFVVEHVLLTICVLAPAVRLRRWGPHFLVFESPDFAWDLLDFVIVVSSVMDMWGRRSWR